MLAAETRKESTDHGLTVLSTVVLAVVASVTFSDGTAPGE
jgi:hypothetical protein